MRPFWIISALMMCWSALPAQDAEYSMHMFSGLYLNPAYAGSRTGPVITAAYRHQWTRIEGAPRSLNVSGHGSLARDLYAVGGSLHYDQLGTEQSYRADFDFAFRLKVKNADHRIALGIRTGMHFYRVRPGDYRPTSTSPLDPVLEANYTSFIPNFGFGIYADGKRYFAGVSIPRIADLTFGKRDKGYRGDSLTADRRVLYITAGGLIGSENASVRWKPTFVYRYTDRNPWDIDVNMSMLIADRVWLGAGYRTGGDRDNQRGESVTGILKFKATHQLEIGYAYDHTLSRLGAFNSGTHEIMISFQMERKPLMYVTPRFTSHF